MYTEIQIFHNLLQKRQHLIHVNHNKNTLKLYKSVLLHPSKTSAKLVRTCSVKYRRSSMDVIGGTLMPVSVVQPALPENTLHSSRL